MTFDDFIDERIKSRIKELVAAMQTEETFHDFSWALDMLKQSCKVARGSWEGDKRHPTLGLIRNSGRAQVIKWAASGYAAKVWRPLQEDILANDWYEVK